MSYPLSLDEYDEDRLVAELDRRRAMRRVGRCDYCGRPPEAKPCRFPERHNPELYAREQCFKLCSSESVPCTCEKRSSK